MVISAPREEPICWSVSKVEDMNVKGIIRLTFKQDKWNPHTDFIEKDEDGNVIGMWCNYNDTPIIPESAYDPIVPTKVTKISCSGIKPELKVGGSYKKLTVRFLDGTDETENTEYAFQPGEWAFTIDGSDASDLLEIKYPESFNDKNTLEENQCKIKFIGPNDYIGKVLMAKYICDTDKGAEFKSSGYIEMSIIGL